MNARIADASLVLELPYSTVHVTALDVKDHAVMRARQLAALLLAIQPPDGPDHLLWLAQQMSDEIVGALTRMAGQA